MRPIVPFLGAGISLSSGFPSISAIVEYLSKVDFAIQHEVYSHRYPDIQISKKVVAREYQEHPSRFLRDFGWPRLGQLDTDLWEWLDRDSGPEQNSPIESDSYLRHAKEKVKLIYDKEKIKLSYKNDDNVTRGLGLMRLKVSDMQLLIDQELYRQQQIASRILSPTSQPELLDLISRDICPSSYDVRIASSQNPSDEVTEFIITSLIAAESNEIVT